MSDEIESCLLPLTMKTVWPSHWTVIEPAFGFEAGCTRTLVGEFDGDHGPCRGWHGFGGEGRQPCAILLDVSPLYFKMLRWDLEGGLCHAQHIGREIRGGAVCRFVVVAFIIL
jgi:hypothetical protein